MTHVTSPTDSAEPEGTPARGKRRIALSVGLGVVAVTLLVAAPLALRHGRSASLRSESALSAATRVGNVGGTSDSRSASNSAAASAEVASSAVSSVANGEWQTLTQAAYRKTAPVPTAGQVRTATAWATHRQGIVSFAVIDSRGHLSGLHADQQYVSASVVKAMLLVAYLRAHPSISSGARATLSSMIRVSDNNAADTIYQAVGNGGLYAVARRAGMRNFSVSGWWTNAQITPADQARFFYNMDRLIPKQHVGFARGLLSSIVSYQSWGVAKAGRARGWKVYFKGGWRGTARGQLVHQAARLEMPGERIVIVVMTDGDPSMGYGIATVEGIAARVLSARP